MIVTETDAKSCQCAAKRSLSLNLSENNTADMLIVVKHLAPQDGWEPEQKEKVIQIVKNV